MLRLLRYNLNVRYTPGSQVFIADTLSRAFPQADPNTTEELSDILRVHSTTATMPSTAEKLKEVRNATREDFVKMGWPKSQREFNIPQGQYWKLKDDLST